MMYLVALSGSVLGLLGFCSSRIFITRIPFALMWVLYRSLYQVGGQFMSFQWDILLLEVGFLAFLFAPFLPSSFKKDSVWARVIREMMKWLLIRLMISSGLTKMFSGCPTWWKFTALNYHFET